MCIASDQLFHIAVGSFLGLTCNARQSPPQRFHGISIGTVLLIAADADFIPALEKAKGCRKELRVAFPPGHNSEEMQASCKSAGSPA